MKKLIILTLDGNFHQGFRASLEVAQEGSRPFLSLKDEALQLPSLPMMPDVYQQWYVSYRSLDGYRIKPKKAQVTNVRFTELKQQCEVHATLVQKQFTAWLEADQFRPIKEECLSQLASCDEARLIIRTTDSQIRKLPWHLWDLFDKSKHPHLEVALSSQGKRIPRPHRTQVRILVVLGNSEGIDISQDNALLMQYCGEAELVFLVEPERQTLNEHLWEKQGWDMLFFSGHSRTEGEKGRIFLNGTDSLTIDELRYGLQNAIDKGLQIAFFNSCDGLGIATELEKLNIPQLIVMREPVPDKVAQQFLKYFLAEFTQGASFYQAVRTSREKLQGLEGEYPCASWLPMICQDILTIPPTWRSLGAISHCPYRGLSAFREDDAAYFFGREDTIKRLADAVKNKPMVAIIGASGSGKSSLVFAGLIPYLKQDKDDDWQFLNFRPGNNPFEALTMALSPILSQSSAKSSQEGFKESVSSLDITSRLNEPELSQVRFKEDDSVETQDLSKNYRINTHQRLNELKLELQFKQDTQALTHCIDANSQLNTRLVLIVDQFEELYTHCMDAEKQQQFLALLLDAVANAPNFTLIITLRADFYSNALAYRPFSDALQEAHFNLGLMTPQELEAAMEKPADLFNVKLESGLAQRILSENPLLPLLEFALTQLWTKQRHETLTHQGYDEIGGVEKALANHAERVYAQFTPEDRERSQQIFIQLVQPTTEAIGIRRLAKREELGDDNWQIVAKLADARLVMTNRNQITGEETVEIIHEALINHWGRLKQWMRLAGDFRRWQEQLRLNQQQWEDSGRDNDVLLRGRLLSDAQDWLQQKADYLSQAEKQYIESSLQQQNVIKQNLERNRRRVIAGLTGGLVSVSCLAIFALLQWKMATLNRIDTLLSAANFASATGEEIEAMKRILNASQEIQLLPPIFSSFERQQQLMSLGGIVGSLREYNRLQAHQGSVNSLSYRQDGRIFASASSDKTIKIWNSRGMIQQMLGRVCKSDVQEGCSDDKLEYAHYQDILLVNFSPEGDKLISVSEDRVNIWTKNHNNAQFSGEEDKLIPVVKEDVNLETGNKTDNKFNSRTNKNNGTNYQFFAKPSLTLRDTDQFSAAILTSDGKQIISTTTNGKIKFWDLKGKLLKTVQGHSSRIWSLVLSPDGKTFATSGADKTVKIWNLQGELVKTLDKYPDEVLSIAFSPTGDNLAVGLKNNQIYLQKLQDNSPKILENHTDEVLFVQFSPDGKTLVSGSNDTTIKLWDVQQGVLLDTLTGHKGKVTEVQFSPDGKTFISGGGDGNIRFWNKESFYPSFTGNSVSFSPDNQLIAVGNTKGMVTLRNRDGSIRKTFPTHQGEIHGIRFSPDNQQLVTIGEDNQIKIWNLDGNLLKSWQGHQKHPILPIPAIEAIEFTADGQYLVTIGSDNLVKVWDKEGNLQQKWQGDDRTMTAMSVSRDGKIVATASIDHTVKLWRLKDGQLITTLKGHEDNITQIKFSPDDKYIATGSIDQTVRLWTVKGELIGKSDDQTAVYSLNFSPDSQFLLSGGKHHGLKMFGVQINLPKLAYISPTEENITDVQFSPDGETIAFVNTFNQQVSLVNFDLNSIQQKGCNWLQDYLVFSHVGTDSSLYTLCQIYRPLRK